MFFALEERAWKELTSTWRGLPEEALIRPGACGGVRAMYSSPAVLREILGCGGKPRYDEQLNHLREHRAQGEI
jgi:hypothetical protein